MEAFELVFGFGAGVVWILLGVGVHELFRRAGGKAATGLTILAWPLLLLMVAVGAPVNGLERD